MILGLLGLLVARAHAEPPRHVTTVSGVAAADLAVNQIYGGAELAVHPNQDQGLAGQALVQPTWSVTENTALLWVEAGGTVVIPYEEEPVMVRLGVWGRAGLPVVRYPLPVRFGEVGRPGTGLVPSGGGLLELAWRARPLKKDLDRPEADRRWSPAAVLGIRGGIGSEFLSCGFDEEILPDCAAWMGGVAFAIYTRVDLRQRVHLEARLGTTLSLAIGGRLGPRPGE